MLNCREMMALFSDFVDGEFEDEIRNEFIVHLKQCPLCGCHFRTFEKTVIICKSLKKHEYFEIPQEIHNDFWEFIKMEIYGSRDENAGTPALKTSPKKNSGCKKLRKNG